MTKKERERVEISTIRRRPSKEAAREATSENAEEEKKKEERGRKRHRERDAEWRENGTKRTKKDMTLLWNMLKKAKPRSRENAARKIDGIAGIPDEELGTAKRTQNDGYLVTMRDHRDLLLRLFVVICVLPSIMI